MYQNQNRSRYRNDWHATCKSKDMSTNWNTVLHLTRERGIEPRWNHLSVFTDEPREYMECFEVGRLPPERVHALFQDLLDNQLLWHLSWYYQQWGQALLRQGVIKVRRKQSRR